MNKKYIKTIVMTVVTTVLMFVVSYAWFDGDYYNKNIYNNEVNISTSKDLILSYKNVVYTQLNLKNILPEEFEFGQVSSTGLNNSKFYKINYEKELDNLPAEYVEAVANEDYLEFNIKITASDTPKRVYLDCVNSGFKDATNAFEGYTGIKPADCMRCSLSFSDSSTSTNRTIVLANSSIGSYPNSSNVSVYNNCVQENDLVRYARDNGGNEIKTRPLYEGGIAQYNKSIEPKEIGDEYADVTGIQIPNYFTDFDYSGTSTLNSMTEENAILFDLMPYQEKNITVRIWLEGSTIPETEASLNYIAGRYITFNLKFNSTTDKSVDYNVRYIDPGMNIDTINDYLGRTGKDAFSNVIIDEASSDYKFRNYVKSGSDYRINDGGVVYTYTLDSTTGYYHCTNSNYDKLYYNIERSAAYVPYSALSWKLNNVSKRRDYGETVDTVSIARIDAVTNKIVIPNYRFTNNSIVYDAPIRGETFTLIGYYGGVVENFVVVNELYVSADVNTVEEKVYVTNSGMVSENTFSKSIETIVTELNNNDSLKGISNLICLFYLLINIKISFSYE